MDGFEELKGLYRQSLVQRRAAIVADWTALCSGEGGEAQVQGLRRQMHQLAGSAGAYGYELLGDTARALEKSFTAWLAPAPDARPAPAALVDALERRMHTLDALIVEAALPAGS